MILNLRNGKVLRDVIIQQAPETQMEIPKTGTEPQAPVATAYSGGGAEAEPAASNATPPDDEADGGHP